jgi:hypothetical protein
MQRDEFEKKFSDYRRYLREEIHRFHETVDVYRQIQERKVDHPELINLAPAFFGVVELSLFTTIVLWGDKLFDEKGECSLFNFLVLVEYNRKWLTTEELKRRRGYSDSHWMLEGRIPVSLELINESRDKIRNLRALNSFHTRRDKYHAHFDSGYFFNREHFQSQAPIHWKDLEEAGEVMGSILNEYSANFDGTSYSWDTLNIDDLDLLLNTAARGMELNAS